MITVFCPFAILLLIAFGLVEEQLVAVQDVHLLNTHQQRLQGIRALSHTLAVVFRLVAGCFFYVVDSACRIYLRNAKYRKESRRGPNYVISCMSAFLVWFSAFEESPN